jgi:hypothetical protein
MEVIQKKLPLAMVKLKAKNTDNLENNPIQ